MVIGDKRAYLTVIIMIDQENVEKFAQDADIPFSNYASLTRAPEVQELIQNEINRVNQKFARVEQIKKFFLLDTQLTAEDEELTPTMKLKRKLVEKIRGTDRCHVLTQFKRRHDMRKTSTAALATLACAAALSASGVHAEESQGVTKTEITLGSIQDLSGPLAGFGKQLRNGMMLRVNEVNEQGGINGRKINLLVEDSGYDPKKAVLAAQKLVNQNKIFMMVGHLGTAQNLAAMPVQFEKNVINFFPVTAAREMYEPFHKLKYAFAATYFDQMKAATPKLVKEKGPEDLLHVPGRRVRPGSAARRGRRPQGRGHDHGRDHHLQARRHRFFLADVQAQGCQLRHGGAGHHHPRDHWRHWHGTQTGLQPHLPGLQRCLYRPDPQTGRQGHGRTLRHDDGAEPYLDDASQPIRFWATKYKTAFNEDPAVFSVYGYLAIDSFIRAAQKAGPNLSTDSFIKAMDTMEIPRDIFGSAVQKFGPQSAWAATSRGCRNCMTAAGPSCRTTLPNEFAGCALLGAP